ncbi:DNA ligase [Dirofilaria immitis]|nr:DNA ligase [Dirofilaria immitis]
MYLRQYVRFCRNSMMVEKIESNKSNGELKISVDDWLEKLSELTREKEQQSHFSKICKLVSCLELKYIIRLIMKDLRINAGAKHILEGLRKGAYELFQNSRNLQTVIEKCQQTDKEKSLESSITLNTPIKPMLAEACRSVKQAMEKCAKEMFAEIKYDGERLQLHKDEAFPTNRDLIVDAEMLLVDTNTGKPLPFGTLGIHKKKQFKDAAVCLSLRERRKFLEDNMKEENEKLEMLISNTIDEGLEGLVLKDLDTIYEPGKRHWLKIKKDYLKGGDMADTADLIVLGAFYGTGNKGGTMSVFLMGVYDKEKQKFCTVTKCGNGHDDATLDQINKELKPKMHQISRIYENLPEWIECSRSLVPDFIVADPKESPVWEITGAEFSRSDNHTASGISIRFPRVTKIRDDKNWETATSLQELETLFELSKTKTDIESKIDDAAISVDIKNKNSAKDEKKASLPRKRKREVNGENSKNDEQIVDDIKDDGDSDQEETEIKKAKIPCKYGAQCFRKTWSIERNLNIRNEMIELEKYACFFIVLFLALLF